MLRMTIIKCDGCGREIPREEDSVSIARGAIWRAITLCLRCGAPAAAFFERIKAQAHRIEPERHIEA